MSENPYEAASVPDTGPAPNAAAANPVSLKVFGILNLVFAVMGVCGIGAAAVTLFVNFIPQDPNIPNPALDLMQNDAGYRIISMVGIALGGVFTIVLVVAGVGLLQRRRYGRTASIAYAWYAIVAQLVMLVVNFFYIYQPMLNQLGQQGGGQPQQSFIAYVSLGTGIVGAFLALIYPVLLLVFMYRRKTIDALR